MIFGGSKEDSVTGRILAACISFFFFFFFFCFLSFVLASGGISVA